MNYCYESEHLKLKLLFENDAPLVLQFLKENKDIFEPYEPHKYDVYYTEEYQRHNLHAETVAFNRQTYYRFYVFLKNNEKDIVGTISFSNVLNFPFSSACLGYKFAEKYQHKGYATEAICCALYAVFRDAKLNRVEAYVMPHNVESIRLLERIGFENEGLSKKCINIQGKYEDHLRFGIVNDFSEKINEQKHY